MLPILVSTYGYQRFSQLQFFAISQILTVIGMYGIFAKAGVKSRIVFVPFVHWIKMGEILGHEKFGMITACLGILRLMMIQMADLEPWKNTPEGAAMIVVIDFGILITAFLFTLATALMFKWLVDCSGMSWLWVIPFLFVPGLTMAYWGMSKSVQVDLW
jgi:hypothetical protein